ncbi:MAG: hypothetical protein NT155_04665 [Candidatus Staskawiczbacteria bacterium]|nr:hypothetical protein [Candidatus Staskawiczbacteria bacterium]
MKNLEIRGEVDPQSGLSEVQPNDEIGKDAEAFEIGENFFKGQGAEVTVTRNARGGKPARLEGGWEVVGPSDKKQGYVVARNERGDQKTFEQKKLAGLQPFQKGEVVEVLGHNGEINRDEVWQVSAVEASGFFKVEIIKGEYKELRVRKSDLIKARIAQLELERKSIMIWEGDLTSQDRGRLGEIDEEAKYWKEKLKMAERLGKEFESGKK